MMYFFGLLIVLILVGIVGFLTAQSILTSKQAAWLLEQINRIPNERLRTILQLLWMIAFTKGKKTND